MSTFHRLATDGGRVAQLGFRLDADAPHIAAAPEGAKPVAYLPDYSALLVGMSFDDFSELTGEDGTISLTPGKKLSFDAACTIAPAKRSALVVAHPALHATSLVWGTSVVPAGLGPTRPTLHLQALKKFDLRELPWLFAIYLYE
jgi:hypothetical protein